MLTPSIFFNQMLQCRFDWGNVYIPTLLPFLLFRETRTVHRRAAKMFIENLEISETALVWEHQGRARGWDVHPSDSGTPVVERVALSAWLKFALRGQAGGYCPGWYWPGIWPSCSS